MFGLASYIAYQKSNSSMSPDEARRRTIEICRDKCGYIADPQSIITDTWDTIDHMYEEFNDQFNPATKPITMAELQSTLENYKGLTIQQITEMIAKS